jgi:hypothetical protein
VKVKRTSFLYLKFGFILFGTKKYQCKSFTISPLTCLQLFRMKAPHAAFMNTHFWCKNNGAKAAHKMLVKLTQGVHSKKGIFVIILIDCCHFLDVTV